MVKKQTIWLLTMLSLVVVLSVYYVQTPPGPKSSQVNVEHNKESKPKSSSEVVSGTDDLFTKLRLEVEDKRSEEKSVLQDKLALTTISAKEKNVVLDEMAAITDMTTKEILLETMIKTEKDFSDAFVQAEGNEVQITVVAKEHNTNLANKVIQMAKLELGMKNVAVTFKIAK